MRTPIIILGLVLLLAGGCAPTGAPAGEAPCEIGTWRTCVTDGNHWGRRTCTASGWSDLCDAPPCAPGDTEACTTPCGSGAVHGCTDDGWWGPCEGVEVCDNEDDDCDGETDEGLEEVCHCSFRWGVRRCEAGAWRHCDTGHPGVPEACNGEDDDCDSETDEGLQRPCESYCEEGFEVCEDGAWVDCTARPPTEEVCNNIDDDCDGETDEEQPEQECGIGQCFRILPTCSKGVPLWCDPTEGAVKEVCDAKDNDCDGETDEDAPACCDPGAVRACSTAVGACLEGISECEADGTWGACTGTVPSPEICDGEDNDCDGETDEGEPGINDPCGSDFALCKSGMTGCVDGAAECLGDVPGGVEICDGKDNDCDGYTDDGLLELVDPMEPNDSCQAATTLNPLPNAEGAITLYPWTLYAADGGMDVDWYEIIPLLQVEPPKPGDTPVLVLDLSVALDDPEGGDVQLCYSKVGCKSVSDLKCPEHDSFSLTWQRPWQTTAPPPRTHLRVSGAPSCEPYVLAIQFQVGYLPKGLDWVGDEGLPEP